METTDTVYLNPPARQHRLTGPGEQVLAYHRSLPGYAPTPLIELPAIASALGVRRVLLKDESSRLGLPAFKILGASYAIARALAARWGLGAAVTVERLRAAAAEHPPVTLICATDGNHGRAVARTAAAIGLGCRVFIPGTLTAQAKRAIAAEGAEVRELDAPYDDVVAAMREHASEQATDGLVIQDTAWPGYHEIPGWIVDGYSTMLAELECQLSETGDARVDLALAPAGVGSLAQAIVTHFRGVEEPPVVAVVEPVAAPAILHALTTGVPRAVPTGRTVMLGLNCGTPSELAWPVLRDGVDAAVLVDDDEALCAVRELREAGVDSGPCGAATLAGARRVLDRARGPLGLDGDSTVVLFNTESLAANPV
ncbi:diaminopropionate ammonia-lyase [Leucobacter massiliensis]|uniref:Diaminopropionate ammonia-lyase n=1 Tax=Leucobacter massiliensis TaxID=1686285 RepID=A0A2S9QS06_9MICO|nr:diaminopropionate ammonia-lyase [Leucobacter massiliensis]PRI12371.1 diaminopropionate ammonia-lyase [Leucobacter massiliensis]